MATARIWNRYTEAIREVEDGPAGLRWTSASFAGNDACASIYRRVFWSTHRLAQLFVQIRIRLPRRAVVELVVTATRGKILAVTRPPLVLATELSGTLVESSFVGTPGERLLLGVIDHVSKDRRQSFEPLFVLGFVDLTIRRFRRLRRRVGALFVLVLPSGAHVSAVSPAAERRLASSTHSTALAP